MKFGLREKIFSCALMAVSVFFILFDQLYLKPKLNQSLQSTKINLIQNAEHFVKIINSQTTPENIKAITQSLVKMTDMNYDEFPVFLLKPDKVYTEADPGYDVKNILTKALNEGRAQGYFKHQKTLKRKYAFAIHQNEKILLFSHTLENSYDVYDTEKTYLVAASLISLLVCFLYAHVLSRRIG